MKSVLDGIATDPDRLILGQFLTAWHEHFGEDAKLVREAVARTRTGHVGADEFEDVLRDITGDREKNQRQKTRSLDDPSRRAGCGWAAYCESAQDQQCRELACGVGYVD